MNKKTKKKGQNRGTWFGVNPVTRVVPNKKKYSRNQAKREIYKTKQRRNDDE